jgi:hypothetical protein
VSRGRLPTAGLAVLLAALVVAPLAIWGGSSLWDDDEEDELRIETLRAGGGDPELVVSLPDDDLNTLETSGGKPSVTFECLDASGAVELRVEHLFPFTDTDGGVQPPHVHQRLSRRQLSAIERCRLEDTTPPLQGPVEPAGGGYGRTRQERRPRCRSRSRPAA